MSDFIEREAAIKKLDHFQSHLHTVEGTHAIGVAKTLIKEIHTADVRPVVRGKWLAGNDNPRTYGRIRAMCGRCGAFALAEMVNAGSYKEQLSNFCPNCGADMREES